MSKNTNNSFGLVAKLFHWVLAVLMIGMVALGFVMEGMPPSDDKWVLYDNIHKPTGVIIFALVILRLTWRTTNVQPSLPHTIPLIKQLAAKLNNVLLYLLMLGIPITGFLMSTFGGHPVKLYGLYTIEPFAEHSIWGVVGKEGHTILSYILCAAFALHLLAAIQHHFILKDNILRRMWFGASEK